MISIMMGTNFAPIVSDLFFLCYERGFMESLSNDKQAGYIEVFNAVSRCLCNLLNIKKILTLKARRIEFIHLSCS